MIEVHNRKTAVYLRKTTSPLTTGRKPVIQDYICGLALIQKLLIAITPHEKGDNLFLRKRNGILLIVCN